MIGFLVAGLIIGLLARLLLPGRQKIGLLWTLGLGVVGSLIGGTIANVIGSGDIWELNIIGFVCAVVALRRRAQRGRERRPGPGLQEGPAGTAALGLLVAIALAGLLDLVDRVLA